MINGIINVHKEAGFTSHDVVAKLRGICGQKKIGHTGTLDPMATGVLPVCLGSGTKVCDMLTDKDKEYVAELLLGCTTDTQDVTGEVLSECDVTASEEAVREAVLSFVGDYEQVPPMYSALKVNGKKLYELAREGKEVERKARPVRILEIEILDMQLPVVKLRVACSKGTYIRTLCSDIGAALGCGGAMSSLCREASGTFALAACTTLEALDAMELPERLALLRPTESLFTALHAVKLPPFFEKLARAGNEIYQKKISTKYPVGTRVRMMGADGFFALGEVGEYEGGTAIKAIKLFSL